MMSKSSNQAGKVQKPFTQKPTGEKSGTHAFSQKGKPKDLNWKSPNKKR